MDNDSLVTAIFNAILFRDPSQTELTLYSDEIAKGLYTPTNGVLELAKSPEFSQHLTIAKMYKAAFGQYIPSTETAAWRGLLSIGVDVNQIAEQFVGSSAFIARIGGYDSIGAILIELVNEASGITLSSGDAGYYANLIEKGELSGGSALLKISELMSDLEITGGLLHGSLWGNTKTYTKPTADVSERLFVNTVINNYLDNQSSSTDTTGVTGTNLSDDLTANSGAGFIRGSGGNDIITLSSGSDRVIFELSSENNGVDLINNFTIGKEGDILDFSLFLNAPNISLATSPLESTSTAATQWTNGQIINISGYAINTADKVASLFGDGKALAAPTKSSKAVVITSDIVGDASVWFIVNQTSISTIDTTEVSLVGTLSQINNLSLVPFDATNFFTL